MSQTTLKKPASQMLEQDIENSDKTQPPVSQSEIITITPTLPHDSAEVYSQIKGKHTEKVFWTLFTRPPKNNKEAIILGLFVFLSVVGGWGTAYGVQIAITPHVTGTCAPPAVIENGGCFNVETATNSNGQQVTTLIPAGHLQG